jgi:hypothetical protein
VMWMGGGVGVCYGMGGEGGYGVVRALDNFPCSSIRVFEFKRWYNYSVYV